MAAGALASLWAQVAAQALQIRIPLLSPLCDHMSHGHLHGFSWWTPVAVEPQTQTWPSEGTQTLASLCPQVAAQVTQISLILTVVVVSPVLPLNRMHILLHFSIFLSHICSL